MLVIGKMAVAVVKQLLLRVTRLRIQCLVLLFVTKIVKLVGIGKPLRF